MTSISIGQCGFGFAPRARRPRAEHAHDESHRSHPARVLLGMRWDWVTFPSTSTAWIARGLESNVGSLVPFSPLRGYVLGMREARHPLRRSRTLN